MFKPYESKPITRMAMVIDGPVVRTGTNDYNHLGIQFKAYQPPLQGDYICRLTDEDTYHVAKAVFEERNIVEVQN